MPPMTNEGAAKRVHSMLVDVIDSPPSEALADMQYALADMRLCVRAYNPPCGWYAGSLMTLSILLMDCQPARMASHRVGQAVVCIARQRHRFGHIELLHDGRRQRQHLSVDPGGVHAGDPDVVEVAELLDQL